MMVGLLRWFTLGLVLLGFGAGIASADHGHDSEQAKHHRLDPEQAKRKSSASDTLDGEWKGNMRCGDNNRVPFEFRVSGGRFTYIGNSFDMRGEIKDGGYEIGGNLATGRSFSFSGSVGDGQINDSSTSLFSGGGGFYIFGNS